MHWVLRCTGPLALLYLAACAPDGSFSSSRPVGGPVLSETCQRAYQAYLDEREPAYFATDAAGQVCAAVVCRHRYCITAFPGQAVRACERVSDGADCFVYADGRTYSWRGPEPVAGAGGADVDREAGTALFIRLPRDPFARFRDD